MLPEDMWLDWIKDEQMCLGAEGREGQSQIIALFEKSLNDYKYRRVMKKYFKFMLKEHDNKQCSASDVRAVFEKCLEIYALDYENSHKFWAPYL